MGAWDLNARAGECYITAHHVLLYVSGQTDASFDCQMLFLVRKAIKIDDIAEVF